MFGLSGTAQFRYNFPPPDTFYYPFYDGSQMIEIDHTTYFNLLDIEYLSVSQAPYWLSQRPIGNEYLMRDSIGRIIESFNIDCNFDSLENVLRQPSFVNRLFHHDTPQLFMSSYHPQGSFFAFKFIFNYNIKNYDDHDSTKRKNLKYGLIDTLGKVFLPAHFSSILFFHGNILLKKNKDWGLVSIQKQTIIPCEYPDYRTTKSFLYFLKNGTHQVAFHNPTKQIISLESYSHPINEKEGLFIFEKDSNIGLMNILKDQPIIEAQFDNISQFHYKYGNEEIVFLVKKGSKFGIINPNGKVLLPCQYDRIHWWRKEYKAYFEVTLDGKSFRVKPLP